MIRKFARLEADAEGVRRLFADVDGWPRWMPGIIRIDPISGSGNRRVVQLHQRFVGKTFAAKVEIAVETDGLRQRQLSGWLKHWDSRWRFVPRPEDGGTTLSLELEIELGIAGLLISPRTVQRTIDGLFRQAVDRSQKQLRSVASTTGSSEVDGETLLQVFRTADGLEIWIEGRRYTLVADDRARRRQEGPP